MKYLIAIAALMWSATALCDDWKLSEHIAVTPTQDLDVTFQIQEDFDPNQEIVHGWQGEDLHYLLIAERQPGGVTVKKYWRGMLRHMKRDADNKKLNIHSEGSYTTTSNKEISYKLLSWNSDGEESFQMLNLIVGEKDAYWIIAIPTSDDIDYMVKSTTALLKTTALLR